MASLKFKQVLCLIYSGILFLSGTVLVGFAIVLCYKLFYHFKFVSVDTVGPFAVIILVGLVHLSISWLGVKGPSMEHDFFIILFVIFAVVLLMVEFALGVWSMVLWAGVEDSSVALMVESQNNYFKHGYDKNEWVTLESKLSCCGLNGTQDYLNEKQSVPFSCFRTCEEMSIINNNKSCSEPYQLGCGEPFINYVKKLLLQAALASFISGLYQIAGIASFILFYKALKEERAKRAATRASRLRQSLSRPRVLPSLPQEQHSPTAPSQ